MLKIRPGWLFVLLVLFALAIVPAAGAMLSPMSFGFPAMTKSASGTAFNTADVKAFDIENVDFSPCGLGIPAIGQSSVVGQNAVQTQFAQNTVFSAYSYPAVGFGTPGISGFDCIPGFGSLL